MRASDYPGNEWAAWAPCAGTHRGGIDSIQYLKLYILFLHPERTPLPPECACCASSSAALAKHCSSAAPVPSAVTPRHPDQRRRLTRRSHVPLAALPLLAVALAKSLALPVAGWQAGLSRKQHTQVLCERWTPAPPRSRWTLMRRQRLAGSQPLSASGGGVTGPLRVHWFTATALPTALAGTARVAVCTLYSVVLFSTRPTVFTRGQPPASESTSAIQVYVEIHKVGTVAP